MPLFSILVDIASRTASFESGIDRIDKRLQHFGENTKRILEVVTAGALVEFGKRVIEAGDQMEHAATMAGVNAKAFSELAYAAKTTNVSQASLADTFTKMNRAISEAVTGGAKQNETLHALGLTFRDLQGLRPEDQFELLADRISKLGTAGDKARAEVVLFGKSGAELGPLFEKGAAGIRKAREEAQRLGVSFSEEQLKSLEESHKAIERLETAFSGLSTTLVGKVAPGLTSIIDKFTALFSGDPILKLKEQIASLNDYASRGEGFFALGYGEVGTGYFSAEGAAAKSLELQQKLRLMLPAVTHSRGLSLAAPPPGFVADQLEDFNPTARKLFGRPGVNPIIDQWDQQTRRAVERAQAEFDETEAHLKGILQDNPGFLDEFGRRMDEARQKFNNAIDISPVFITARKQVDVFLTEAQRNVKNFVGDFENSLAAAARQSGAFGKNFARGLINALEDRAIFRAIDAIGSALERSLLKGSSGNGLLGSILSGIFGSGASFGYAGSGAAANSALSDAGFGAGYKLPGFATGGSFTVGGSGGTDSQLVAFRASPGEGVSVGQGGGGIVINNYMDNRGATTDFVAAMPEILRKNNERLKADIITGLSNRRYNVR